MIIKIGLGLLAVVVAILLFAMTKPDTFAIERSIRIGAAPDSIFPFLNDFHRWSAWSPWEKMDPGMTRTFSGAPSGVGAIYAWSGNKQVGQGRMEIQESMAPSRIVLALDFLAPFEAHNTTEFTLDLVEDSTTVTWTMHGPNLFLGKVMSVFVSMDKMVGPDFEAGLADLKAAAEQ